MQNLIANDSLNSRFEKIFGRPFPLVVSHPDSSRLGSLPMGMVEITDEVRRQEEELRKLLLYEEERPIPKSLHGKRKNGSKPSLTESGSTSYPRMSRCR